LPFSSLPPSPPGFGLSFGARRRQAAGLSRAEQTGVQQGLATFAPYPLPPPAGYRTWMGGPPLFHSLFLPSFLFSSTYESLVSPVLAPQEPSPHLLISIALHRAWLPFLVKVIHFHTLGLYPLRPFGRGGTQWLNIPYLL
jgi:hypothetical protein